MQLMTSEAILACGGSRPCAEGRRLCARHVSRTATMAPAWDSIVRVSRMAEVSRVMLISTRLWSLWLPRKVG